jgi:hypothetical protein
MSPQTTPLTKCSSPRKVYIEENSNTNQAMTEQQVSTASQRQEEPSNSLKRESVMVVPQEPTPAGSTKKKKKISFDQIEIIELPIILGDHPCVQDGPPVSVCWKSQLRVSVCLERFENARKQHRRRFPHRISKCTRQDLLARHGFCQRDMDQATIEAKKTKLERFFSLMSSSSSPTNHTDDSR